jgi:hypothetical protein
MKMQVPQNTVLVATEQTRLDLVVPFTTPELTRTAIAAAGRMGDGLHASIRLLKVQCVPYPLALNESPVFVGFLREQLNSFRSALPLTSEIHFAREFEPGLQDGLNEDSVVVLSYRKRPWRTRNERLAASLIRAGRKVILIPQETNTLDKHA